MCFMDESSFLDKEELELLNSPFVGELFEGIDKSLSEPLFTISHFDLSARDASYWDEKGILPNHCGTGKRRKYNLVQGAWIKLIQQLRELGVSTETIKKLKENLLQEQITLNDVLRDPRAREALELHLKNIGQLEAYQEMQKDAELMKDADKPVLSMFALMVKYCVVLRKPLAIMVFPDGTFLMNNLKKLRDLNEKYENVDDILNTPHSVVSISKAYQSLVVGWSDKPFFPELGIITNEEKEILAVLKDPGLKSVEIKTKDGVLDLMAVCREHKISPGAKISEIIVKNGYHHIDIKTRNGKIVSYSNKQMQKLSKAL